MVTVNVNTTGPKNGEYKILILVNNHLHIFLPNAEQNINWHLPPNVYRT